MNETTMTVTGNLVHGPELRFTPAGQPAARFRIASAPRYRDNATGEWKDGEPLFLTCQAWRQMAENTAGSLTKGTRVIVTGRLRQRSYDAKDGSGKRTVYELEADEAGPSLRAATAKVIKASRAGAGNEGQDQAPAPTRGPPRNPQAATAPSRRSSQPQQAERPPGPLRAGALLYAPAKLILSEMRLDEIS